MRFSINALLTALLLTVAAAAAWFLIVPKFLTLSSFIGVVGVAAGCLYVTRITWLNARPASSLAQSLYDIDVAEAIERTSRSTEGNSMETR